MGGYSMGGKARIIVAPPQNQLPAEHRLGDEMSILLRAARNWQPALTIRVSLAREDRGEVHSSNPGRGTIDHAARHHLDSPLITVPIPLPRSSDRPPSHPVHSCGPNHASPCLRNSSPGAYTHRTDSKDVDMRFSTSK